MSSPPRYATRRRPERSTTGPAVAVIARSLGFDFMPAQRQIVDVAGELVDGVLAYSTVIVALPRRAGKTLLALAVLLERAMTGRRRRAWYTAQSRADAALTLRDEWTPLIATSPVSPYVPIRLANGSEAVTIPRLASTVRIFAPTPSALHGQAGDLIMFDEAWSFSRARGAELEVAARPLMATRPGAQTWILSAAGDIDSTWWADQLELGRQAAAADTGRGVCFLEWSADAPGLDLDDPAVWFASHPAAGHTITLDWLRDEHDRNPDQFQRVYLNITDRTGGGAAPLDVELWNRLTVDDWPRTGDLVAGVACSPDQETTAVVIAGVVDDVPVVELVDYRPGHGWAAGRIVELVDRWNLATVAVDPGGPAGVLVRPLRIAGVHLTELPLRDCTAAAAALVEAVRTAQLRHRPHPALDAAVVGARRRMIGDGSWLFGRREAGADVAPIEAVTFARYVIPGLYEAAAGVA
jgi:hypothetical protein